MLTLTISGRGLNSDASKLRSVAYVAIGPIWGKRLWLEGFLGSEPRVVKLKSAMDYRVKVVYLGKSAGRAPCYKVHPGICLTTEKNHGKNSVRVAEKMPFGKSRSVRGHLAG